MIIVLCLVIVILLAGILSAYRDDVLDKKILRAQEANHQIVMAMLTAIRQEFEHANTPDEERWPL